jgi:hypothetical protein
MGFWALDSNLYHRLRGLGPVAGELSGGGGWMGANTFTCHAVGLEVKGTDGSASEMMKQAHCSGGRWPFYSAEIERDEQLQP